MDFTTYYVDLELKAPFAVSFPPFGAANLIRGHFGKELFRKQKGLYDRLFNPIPLSQTPSGLKNPPRPYVLRTSHLDGRSFKEGEPMPFHLNLFDPSLLESNFSSTISLDPSADASQVRIDFLTPTELKDSPMPEFGILFARLRDRISDLRALYGGGPLDIDFKAIGERARQIQMTECKVEQVNRLRTSRSTGHTHPISGFIGHAIYEGGLGEFLPYLRIGFDTGVGRQTVWGKGQIETTVL